MPIAPPYRSRSNRTILAIVAALAASSMACTRRADAPVPADRDPARPSNVIFLVLDALRADHVGALGYRRDTTPNLDALARRGILFTRAYSASSWTLPSVASLMTSVYPSVHRLTRPPNDPVHDALATEFLTLAESFRDQGFATASITSQPWVSDSTGLTQGFDEARTVASASVPGEPCLLARALIDWLRQPRARNFFLYAHFMGPHSPYDVPSAFTGRYTAGRPVPATIEEFHRLYEFESEAQAYRQISDRAKEEGLTAEDIAYLEDEYDEKLAATDACLAELFEELERGRVFDDTVVLVTADHGEAFYEHGTIFHGEHVHEELVRVPLIVRLPGDGWKPARIDGVVELIDLYPTVHELLGLPIPPHVQGRSLVPLMRGGPGDGVAFCESDEFKVVTPAWSSFYRYNQSLHLSSGFVATKLYDLVADPLERHDLAGSAGRVIAAAQRHREAAFDVWQGILAARTGLDFRATEARLDEETETGLRSLGYLGETP
jgi:arylsulfatase